MAFTTFSSGTLIKSSEVNENFDRVGLQADESATDTTEYTESASGGFVLKKTYTLTPTYTPVIPVGIKLEYTRKVTSAAGDRYIKFALDDGTDNIDLINSTTSSDTSFWSTETIDNTTYATNTLYFGVGGTPTNGSGTNLITAASVMPGSGTTLALKMYLYGAAQTVSVKDIKVTFYYFAGGNLTTSSGKIVAS